MADTEFNPLRFSEDAPRDRVDVALASTKNRTEADSDVLAREELEAMKSDVARIRESAEGRAWASGEFARRKSVDMRDDVKRRIREKPIAAVLLAAFVGYVYGATR